ncbi:16S rRNA (guanine(527)-N(7))-methyltransferase RsmG [Thermodesulfatator atlanticus]|uniref:16S rRNA (guanine(527)-N(7))-methyltransferase RsmG n=1 Tax=Thermodesulfatator atlanticus TaxID=501497 RepID=UPI0003B3793A|nr:16S rRNA (guanine(527)-N(7))-methyltransferase RsmG [Thermodesulfatator atlanticus]
MNASQLTFKETLLKGLKELGLRLEAEAITGLLRYFSLLKEFSEPLGLTALKDPKEIAVKHFLDSLTILPHLPEGPLLDLGTGAGFPGMVVKIARPEKEVWLVDSRKRPISFLTYVVGILGLKNIKIVKATVGKNDKLPRKYFSCVTSRAVTELTSLWELGRPLLAEKGILLAMKGPKGPEEIPKLKEKHPEITCEVKELRLPITKEPRTLILVRESPS